MPDRRRISKLLSLILRHRPDEFGLNMDEYGYIPLDEVVEAVQQRYSAVAEEDIRDLVETSRQHRFEIVDDRIRALYGHSFYVEMDGEPMQPPELLYLCVPAGTGQRMKEEGIRSEDRFYLHLSPTREVAESRAGTVDSPCLVEVKAADAARELGLEFWARGEVVLTRQEIPAEFVGEVIQIEAPASARVEEDEEEERDGRGNRRPRRSREPRPRREEGGGDSQAEVPRDDGARTEGPPARPARSRAPAERPPRDRERPPRRPPPPSSSNGEPSQQPAKPKELTYGRRPKFEHSSRRH